MPASWRARLGAIHLRVDTIEQVLRESAGPQSMNDTGYRVAYAIAEENLRIGNAVIADSVNPLTVTCDAWLEVANRAGVPLLEVEFKCSDVAEHRKRIENRISDIFGLRLPAWEEVVTREYQKWERPHMVIDTAFYSRQESARLVRERLETVAVRESQTGPELPVCDPNHISK